jgi:hypothetical protein
MKEGARVHHSYGSYAPSTYGSFGPRKANPSTALANDVFGDIDNIFRKHDWNLLSCKLLPKTLQAHHSNHIGVSHIEIFALFSGWYDVLQGTQYRIV